MFRGFLCPSGELQFQDWIPGACTCKTTETPVGGSSAFDNQVRTCSEDVKSAECKMGLGFSIERNDHLAIIDDLSIRVFHSRV